MSKELEVVRKLQHCGVEEYREALENVEKILLEYEQIKNAKPSEAFEKIGSATIEEDLSVRDIYYDEYDIVKQALLKAQEQEKEIRALKLDLEEQSELAKHYLEEQEKVLEIIKKHFIIEIQEESKLNGDAWGRFVSIQSKEDEGTWDTTATANLVDYEEEFDILKRCFKNE